MMRASVRHGFALLVVLWVMVGLAALGVAASLAAREAVATAYNRHMLTRAFWSAEDCLARLQAALADVMEGGGTQHDPRAVWTAIDAAAESSPLLVGVPCDVTLRAAGSAADANAADRDQLVALFAAAGIGRPAADSLADALLDWRDADDVPRPFGDERAWYDSAHRDPPRNGPFAAARELVRVRGFDRLSNLSDLIDVEPGRICLAHAPAPVLASLPGFTREAVERVLELRARGEGIPDLLIFAGLLSRVARDSLTARYADLVRVATVEPDAWLATIRTTAGDAPPVTATIEARFVRAGTRVALVRRRGWP